MKTVTIIRHADCLGDHLTEKGIEQAQILGKTLKTLVDGQNPRLFSSNAPRAIATAQIMNETLKLPKENIEYLDIFWGTQGFTSMFATEPTGELLSKMAYIKANFPHAILLSHQELIKWLTRDWMNKDFKTPIPFNINRGQGIYFDLQAKMYQQIPEGSMHDY